MGKEITKSIEQEEWYKRDFYWKVLSKSNPGEYHIVSWSEGKGWRCDCIAYVMGKECRHIKIVKSKWEKK